MTIRSDTANEKRGMKDKLIMGVREEKIIKRKNAPKKPKFSKGIYSMKVKSLFSEICVEW